MNLKYVTLEYINDFLSVNPYIYQMWELLDDAQKQRWINYVENIIDTQIKWIGEKEDTQQTNEFPRVLEKNFFYEQEKKLVKGHEYYIEQIKRDYPGIPDSIRESIGMSIDDLLESQQFRKLQQLNKIGVESFNAGAQFKFTDDDKWDKPLPKRAWKHIYYLTEYYWNRNQIPFIKTL